MPTNIEITAGSSPRSAISPEQRELEAVVLELRWLVEGRRLLEIGNGSEAELEAKAAEIDRRRERLVRLVQEDGDGLGSAA